MRDFLFLLGKHRWEYGLLVACTSLLMGGEALIQPLLMKAIFDGVTRQTEFRSFIPLGLGYLALGVSVNALSYFVFNWRTRVDNKIVSTVSSELLQSFYSVDYSDLLENGAGHYVSRIRSDVKDGLAPMLVAVRDIASGVTSFVMLISVLIYISFAAFLALMVLIPFCASVSLLLSKRIRRLTTAERDYEATVIDVLNRSIAAFKIVRQYSLVPSTTANFSRSLDQGLESSFARFRLVRLLQVAGDMTRVMSDVSSIFVGAFLVIHSQMTIGSFIAFMNAFWRSSSTLFQVLNKWADMHSYVSTISRIAAFQRSRRTVREAGSGDDVCVRNVAFSYGADTVVDRISLDVKRGERVLITGENGSGKTTLANILCGLLSPSEGSISLPSNVVGATLPTHFPPTSVESLGIDETLLESLGMGAKSIRTMRPDFLSAGQQQKLAVAMAISTSADLYVIDEPFANLDVVSRETMLAEIMARTKDKMLVLIAHDPREYEHLFDRRVEIGRPVSDKPAREAA